MPKKTKVSEETWDKLRMEYISSSDVSIRGLEKKYGIPYNAIRNRVENEKWLDQRTELKEQTTQKSIGLVSDFQASECSRAFRIANKVMDKLEEIVVMIDASDEYATKKLKDVTGAIKNLKEIGLFRAELDKQEQMARIKKLQKDAEEEQVDTTITVKFMEDSYGD